MPAIPGLSVKFGQTLQKHRKERDLTIEQLAERSGLTPNYIEALERGDREPSLSTLGALAAGLEVSPADLVR